LRLASLKSGGRDGTLVVVSADLHRCRGVPEIAATLQRALDRWDEIAPKLQIVAAQLDAGDLSGSRPFDPRLCAAPLPRAYHWADFSAYVNHVELVRKARGAELPQAFWTDPLVYQGGSDDFLGPTDDAAFVSAEHGIDLEAELAAITDDVPLGIRAADAQARIKLLMLAND
jgi:fumarylacetoacetate (FAA) hydrolase